jgi:hypothetical protein
MGHDPLEYVLNRMEAERDKPTPHDGYAPARKELLDGIAALRDDLKEVLEDKRRLTRELDVAMHGKEGAAKQASLCDLIEPARRLRKERVAARGERDAALEELQRIRLGMGDDYGDDPVAVIDFLKAENKRLREELRRRAEEGK